MPSRYGRMAYSCQLSLANGRSGLSREDAVRLDLRYVEDWSFVLDLQILWKTCSAVVKGRGAY